MTTGLSFVPPINLIRAKPIVLEASVRHLTYVHSSLEIVLRRHVSSRFTWSQCAPAVSVTRPDQLTPPHRTKSVFLSSDSFRLVLARMIYA